MINNPPLYPNSIPIDNPIFHNHCPGCIYSGEVGGGGAGLIVSITSLRGSHPNNYYKYSSSMSSHS